MHQESANPGRLLGSIHRRAAIRTSGVPQSLHRLRQTGPSTQAREAERRCRLKRQDSFMGGNIQVAKYPATDQA